MHDYPAKLPGFRATGYKYSQTNTIKRTQFQSGMSRLRLTAMTAPQSYQLNAIMTADELAIFEAWLHHVVRYIEPMRLLIATANDCGIKTVKLLDNGFSKQMINPSRYKIELTVQADQQSLMSAAELTAALA